MKQLDTVELLINKGVNLNSPPIKVDPIKSDRTVHEKYR